MNTRSVNSAAGVILAAMQQNRTAAGIAMALEAAGLLMSPEAARDMASVSTDAVQVAEKAVGELRREHEESARLRARVAELEAERHATNDALADTTLAQRAAERSADRLTRLLAPTQALQPEPGSAP